jgi:hypothetical protein
MEDTVKPRRNERGQLLPGQTSINPSGRPPVPLEVRREAHQILAAATPRAAQRLVELLEDQDPRIALAAASTLLDRVLGKAVTPVDQTVNVSTSIQQAHLAALIEIQKRRKDRLAEQTTGTTDQEIIVVTPQPEE